jgi:pimeloyl-ACP methyl ester carboxylesterase
MRIRRVVRLIVIILLVILFGPLLLPLPPVGVEASSLADPDGQFISVNGLSTYVLARGPLDGPPVMLLHGWGASTFTWRDQIDVLAEAGYRVITFDRPPYGLSTKTGENIPATGDQLATFTAATMDVLGIERAVMVGQSQGGGVVGYFAVMYPERTTGVVFVSGALRPSDDPPSPTSGDTRGSRVGGALGLPPFVIGLLNFPPITRWAQIGIRTFVTPDFSTQILRSAYYDPAMMTPEVAAGYQKQLRVVGWDEGLLNQLRVAPPAPQPLTAAQISAIAAPVMIVWGAEDTWVPLSVGERLRELLPDAAWHVYENVGHLPQEEAPAQFNADLLAFLEATR